MQGIPYTGRNRKLYLGVLFILLAGAAAIRLCAYVNMPYQHDELSALTRLRFDSWGALFRQGIMTDGHPALVQVFLYIWTGMFGTAAWIVKLPFVLCGVGAVYLTWKLTARWISYMAALYTMAWMVALQLPAFHSLHARPYAPGMLLLLWFALVWTRLLQQPEKSIGLYAQYVISALLCAWCHHFTALGALLLGLIGLFRMKKQWRGYLLANGIVLACYIPYLPVTLAQLQYGGLGGDNGWLQAPGGDFFFRFMEHTFNFVLWLSILFAVSVGIYYYKRGGDFRTNNVFNYVTALLFFLPVGIGWCYSVWVNPVLQHSMLVFFLPFFFMIFYRGSEPVSFRMRHAVMPLLIAGLSAYTLYNHRAFTEMSHTSVFRDAFTETEELIAKNKLDKQKGFYFFNENPDYLAFYNQRHIPFYSLRTKNPDYEKCLRAFKSGKYDFMVMANPDDAWMASALEHYDYLYALRRSFNCEIYAASNDLLATGIRMRPQREYVLMHDGIPTAPGSAFTLQNLQKEKQESGYYLIGQSEEYGPRFTSNQPPGFHRTDIICIEVETENPDTTVHLPVIVFQSGNPGGEMSWHASQPHWVKHGRLHKNVFFIHGQDVYSDYITWRNSGFATYLFNPGKKPVRLVNYRILVYKGNPKLFGLTEDITP